LIFIFLLQIFIHPLDFVAKIIPIYTRLINCSGRVGIYYKKSYGWESQTQSDGWLMQLPLSIFRFNSILWIFCALLSLTCFLVLQVLTLLKVSSATTLSMFYSQSKDYSGTSTCYSAVTIFLDF
jgi:hypothetical protein